jgi:hypothetical protein
LCIVTGGVLRCAINVGRTTGLLHSVTDRTHVSLSPNRRTWNAGRRSPKPERPLAKVEAFSRQEEALMRLVIFKSESNLGLYAFAADHGGEKLPPRHGPWTAVGVVRDDKEPPHKMSREVIENSITEQGFQLYRVKNTALG